LGGGSSIRRFKELEVLQEILASTKATFFLGNGDLLAQFGGLIRKDGPAGVALPPP
jgi:hypothetical protein